MPNSPAGRIARKQPRCLAFLPTVWMHNTGGRVRCRCTPLSGWQSTGIHRAADKMHLASLRVWILCLLLKMEQQERLWMALCTLDWPRFISGSVPPRLIGNVGVYRLNQANSFQWHREAQLFASSLHPRHHCPRAASHNYAAQSSSGVAWDEGFLAERRPQPYKRDAGAKGLSSHCAQALPAPPGLRQRMHCALLLLPCVACGSFSISSGSLHGHLKAFFWKKKKHLQISLRSEPESNKLDWLLPANALMEFVVLRHA